MQSLDIFGVNAFIVIQLPRKAKILAPVTPSFLDYFTTLVTGAWLPLFLRKKIIFI
ncbi:hypothetical protein [Rheinheimera nanhaiensis]|uniref:Uncharacterized protein n=1 Tax=Rheinheimera nanhaiensis E407-8 TaxID=562729 RepID=I1DVG3_9GAMM|nr:hypothetical protein [Rheinheimera nanhaiensis]GAB58041.1 hypothetical protein RNAN_1012 [Rheinheimera nanhaiensis E407-8]